MPSITILPGLDCAAVERIDWLLFVGKFCGSYMNSDSCCAKAGGSVVPHGPWKWCLGNITHMLGLDDTTPPFLPQYFGSFLADLREVFRFRCGFCVELGHWDAPGGNQGTEHGCWVNNGGGSHLQVNNEPVRISGKCFIKKTTTQRSCVYTTTHHKAKVTDFHFFFHFGQDVRVHGFSKKHYVGPQQTVAIALVTP